MVTSTPPTGPTATTPAVGSVARGDTSLATWRVGQVLAATVVTAPQPGRAELRIGNLQVTAQTGQLQLSPGQSLRLEVASLRELPVLKLLGVLQQSPVTAALRDVLPRQQPLSPLLNALPRLVAAGQLPAEVARLAGELLSRLPSPLSAGTPAGLRQALRDSGLFLEAKLARPAQPGTAQQGTASGANPAAASTGAQLAGDLKANLLRLVRALRENPANSTPGGTRTPGSAASATSAAAPALPAAAPAATLAAAARALPGLASADPGAPLQRGQPPQPPVAAAELARAQELALSRGELLRQAEGALARIQLNQLSSLPQERAQASEWLIEVPLRRDGETDVWSLRISRDPEGGAGQEAERETGGGPGWTVMLAFDLPGIGPLQSRISLRGDSVAAQFFSRQQGILPLVAEHLPLLQARLQQAGLRVSELSCHHGQIPVPAGAPKTRILDERA